MSKKLLLADDSVVIQKLIGLSFANEDIEIFSTDNGDDALTRAREIKPDVILADVVMPGLSGYEVCEAIKQDPELRQTPVLLLTGTFEAFDEARAASAGADGQITKPFEAQALVDRVTQAMNAPRPVAAARPAASPDAETRLADEAKLPPARTAAPEAPAAPTLEDDLADDLFDGDLDSLDAANLAADSLASDDFGLDLPLDDSSGPAFPAIQEPNENTASGLFGTPGEGASIDFDSHAGSLSLGESVSGAPRPQAAEDATVATDASEPRPALPAAQPVDLDAALAGEPETSEPSILFGRDDVSSTTSSNLASSLGNELARAGSLDDLTVHSPSADIDQDRASSPSPAAASGELGSSSAAGVADLDADLATGARSAVATRPSTAARPTVDAAAETVVTSIDSTDPLDFGPSNVPTDDLDFAFDVSEQVAAENLADRVERGVPDSYGDSFSSLMDISESQILGSAAAEAADASDPGPYSETTEATPTQERVAALRAIDDSIISGYDVSTSDLATADTSFARAAATPPPIPEPERLDVLPELPQARTPASRNLRVTGDDDLFDGLATGSPLDEFGPQESFGIGSDLDIDDDLLARDESVEIGESIPARSSTGAVPLEVQGTPDRNESPTAAHDDVEAIGEAAYVSAAVGAAGAVGAVGLGDSARPAVRAERLEKE
jgi:CheY-like chemotaxis protein